MVKKDSTFYRSVACHCLPGSGCHSFQPQATSQVCQDVELVIKDTVYAGFITKKEVATLLEKKGISPIGKDLERVRTKTLERELAKHPLIDQVECSKPRAASSASK